MIVFPKNIELHKTVVGHTESLNILEKPNNFFFSEKNFRNLV